MIARILRTVAELLEVPADDPMTAHAAYLERELDATRTKLRRTREDLERRLRGQSVMRAEIERLRRDRYELRMLRGEFEAELLRTARELYAQRTELEEARATLRAIGRGDA